MKNTFNFYELDDNRERIDLARVHGWLTKSYWTPGISLELLHHGLQHSCLLVGAYSADLQVGFARVISDRMRFAYLCDVFVAEEHRDQGIGSALTQFCLQHPSLKTVYSWLLATLDAHQLYEKQGFTKLKEPARWMQHSKKADYPAMTKALLNDR